MGNGLYVDYPGSSGRASSNQLKILRIKSEVSQKKQNILPQACSINFCPSLQSVALTYKFQTCQTLLFL